MTEPAEGTGPDDAGQPQPFTTEAELRDWLDGHAARHAEQPDGQCACGWPHVPPQMIDAFQKSQGTKFPSHAQHVTDTLFGELGHLLPSNTSNIDPATGRARPVAWAPLVDGLYATLDRRDSELDPTFLQLMRHLIDTDLMDVLTLANVTVMHPHYLARVLDTALPAPQPEGAPTS